MGRTAAGVRGIRLDPGQRVMSLIVAGEGDVLSVCEKGYGKRTPIDQFPTKGRGTKGLISIRTSARNGDQIGAVLVEEGDEIMLISDSGTLVRTRVSDVSRMGRDAQGVKMIRLGEGEKLIGIARIEALEDDDEEK
jgi:DNA gyrase subunit A